MHKKNLWVQYLNILNEFNHFHKIVKFAYESTKAYTILETPSFAYTHAKICIRMYESIDNNGNTSFAYTNALIIARLLMNIFTSNLSLFQLKKKN